MIGAYELCLAIDKYLKENRLSGKILVSYDYVKVTELKQDDADAPTIIERSSNDGA